MVYDDNLGINLYEVDNLSYREIDMLSTKGIAVSVGGILVAYLVDGVLIYTTGHSGGWLVFEALKWTGTNVKKVFINNDGSSYDVNAKGCIQKVLHGNWHALIFYKFLIQGLLVSIKEER